MLTFFNYPDSLKGMTDDSELENRLAELKFFQPTLNHQLVPETQIFDLKGQLYDAALANTDSGVLAISESLSGALGEALSVFSSLGESQEAQEASALVGAWVDIELKSPNEAKHFRRQLASTLSAEERLNGGYTLESLSSPEKLDMLRYNLSQVHSFMLATGHYSKTYVLAQLLDRLLASRPLFMAMIESLYGDESLSQAPELDPTLLSWLGHLQLYQAFDQLPFASYRAEASLLHYVSSLSPESFRVDIDIIHQSRRSFASPEMMLKAGIQDTFIERDFLSPLGALNHFSAADILLSSQQQASPLQIIKTETELANLDIQPSEKPYMAEDLAAGYLLAMPQEQTGSYSAWWRINPQGGETLGRGGNGMGPATVEYALWVRVTAAVMLGLITFAHCEALAASIGKGDSKAMTCFGLGATVATAPFSVVIGLSIAFIIAGIDIAN
ncbi:MAG: hypothetical protein R2880_06515 [Deinococcales bacterium]